MNIPSWAWKLCLVIAGCLLLYAGYTFVTGSPAKREAAKVELVENQAEAAVESAQDTVTTINNQHTREVVRTDTVRVIEGKVNEAPDAHSAHTAGIDGLCVVSSNLCAKDPVQ